MGTIKKILIPAILLFLISGNPVRSQSPGNDYRFALGLRAGETSGFTFNVNTGRSSGLEFIGGIWSNWLSLTALYEIRASAFDVDGLKWYYGAGGHVAFGTGTYYIEGRNYPRGDDFSIGIDGIVGLEYKIPQIPFAVNLNIKPFFEIYNNGDLYFAIDPGIGVKFTF